MRSDFSLTPPTLVNQKFSAHLRSFLAGTVEKLSDAV